MSKNLRKYLYQEMDKKAGTEHSAKKTKIVATIGPSCNTYDKVVSLARAGVNVFRLNFSHGTQEEKGDIIDMIEKINKTMPFNIAILADLQGPKLRVGEIENNALKIEPGDKLLFTNKECIGNREHIYISYPDLYMDVVPGDKILMDDGKMEVKVLSVKPDKTVEVEVVMGGILSSRKGINLPDTKISLPALTEKDLDDLHFILTKKVDWVALSFVRKVEDIIQIKELLRKHNSLIKVIAKIEKPEALTNIREIILESDGIMIARGDLGVELPVEKVPLIQKEIIRKCMHRAKPVIVATQMMESMIDRVKPNRSEITDVANAVLEGADALMLSAETATGQHPELVIQTMSKIILEVEKEAYDYNREDILSPQPHSPSFLSDAIIYSAAKLAKDLNCDALIGMTQSGYTGFVLSSFRPKCPLYVFSKEQSLINQLSLSWGVRAFFYEEEVSLDDIFYDQITILKERGFIKAGDVVVNTGSTPVNKHLPTNIVKVTKVKDDEAKIS
jgi:pyruvate kinase